MTIQVHFVGVKGSGMSALAQVCAQIENAIITGSDVEEHFFTDIILEKANIPILPFAKENIDKADLIVASAAYNKDNNIEIARAIELGKEILYYPQYLGRLMSKKRGIAVSGTHGKTTTTAMIGLVLMEAGLDPTIVVGSYVPSLGSNAHSGKGEFFLAESCEYRRHFLNYTPEFLIINNIEFDHPDYFTDLNDVISAFNEFAQKVPEHGHIFLYADDPNCAKIKAKVPITTYGFSNQAHIQAKDIVYHDKGSSTKIFVHETYQGDLHLNVSGKHNIINALACIAFCQHIGIDVPFILSALAKFKGTKRRFEQLGCKNGALIVDDYAHHPTEIRTTLEGARLAYPKRRIRAVFQPHTFTRTERLLKDFSQAFNNADEVVIAEIFASAREQNLQTISSATLAELIKQQGIQARYIGTLDDIKTYLAQTLKPEDLILTLGAGDIYKVGESLVC